MRWGALSAGVFALVCASAYAGEPLWVGRFSQALGDWRLAQPSREAAGTVRIRSWDGVMAAELRAERTMTLLERAIADEAVRSSPVLCWRWRIDAPLRKADWETRAGDDFAARVYVGLRTPDQAMSAFLRARMRLARALWGSVCRMPHSTTYGTTAIPSALGARMLTPIARR